MNEPITTFSQLNLPAPIQKALDTMGFETPTPIQAAAIPVALSKQDLIGCAQTGTGKTAAFCIPIALRLIAAPVKTALVLVPTRELAGQIEEVWMALTRFAPQLTATTLIGGMPMPKQIRDLKRYPRLIIATPGRLMDHLHRGTTTLSKTEILVLDEADRMLDMGFAPQLTQILRYLPSVRQTLLFSATMPPEIAQLAHKYLRSPQNITIGSVGRAATLIEQKVIETSAQRKNDTLLDEINKRAGSILIFARTQVRTDRVSRYLASYGLPVNRLHGGRTQGQRKNALDAFKSGDIRILVATDIAARGIDVSEIAHVINYDLPMVAEDYIHRIGRTARAGTSGEAVSLITPEDRDGWKDICRHLSKSGSNIPEVTRSAAPAAPAKTHSLPSSAPTREHRPPRDRPRAGPEGNRAERRHPERRVHATKPNMAPRVVRPQVAGA
jgi:ATP-dependent RNA helicase RhlE